MAVERGYERQVAPGGTAGLPSAGADAFGAGIGQAVAELGGTLHEAEVRAFRVERQQRADAEAADFGARFAAARAEADRASIDARANAAPGGAGHAQAMAKWWEDRRAKLLDGITEDRVRNSATEQLAEFGSRFDAAEYQWESGTRIKKVAEDQQRASDFGANRARLAHDPKSYGEELSLGRQAIEAMTGVPADVREKLVRYHDQTVTIGYLNGLNDTNPAGAVAMLDSGVFGDILSPEQIEQARNGAQVEVRRAEAATQARDAVAKGQARETLALLKARLDAGEEVPDGELVAGAGLATALGDASGAYQLAVERQRAGVNRETQAWTPADFERETARLRGLGDRRSPADDVRLKQIEAIAPKRTGEFNADPGKWAAGAGAPPPSLEAGPQARTSWARAIEGATGEAFVPRLTPAEAAPLAEQIRTGTPAQRYEALQAVRQWGGDVPAVVRQVAGGDRTFELASRLATSGDPATARDALLGVDVPDGQLFKTPSPDDPDKLVDLNTAAVASGFLSGALRRLGGNYIGGLQAAARNIYKARMARNARVVGDPTSYRTALNAALGGVVVNGERRGGMGVWNGAHVVLPSMMSQAEFERKMARASGEAIVAAAGGIAPAWSNGAGFVRMTPGQLKALTPVALADGSYAFATPQGGYVQKLGGGEFRLDWRKLP
ncbi:hypothetical protein [Sphingomonas jatrophae]|uniref:Uncharacterized protein n=1 Tax=Sphingomonas jatrophae TaxID=1166337 RepID=A0A1I6K5A8_9SPHN|nr:hypothetical protein [Sphingomonas jatrophae]SFR86412.1 hypothetical protein SAMN05192580_1344 [Sphingomonas jatrophae]